MIRALLVTLEYPPVHGGVGRFLEKLVYPFRESMSVLADGEPDENDPPFVSRALLLAPSPRHWPRWRRAVTATVTTARRERSELLLAGQLLPIGTAVWFASRRLSIPYGVFAYGMDVLLARRNPWKRFVTSRILREAKFVIVISSYTAALVRAAGVRAANIVLVPPLPGIDPRALPEDRIETFRDEQGIRNRLTFLSAGRLAARKGFDRAIEAFSEARKVLDDPVLLIVGDGPDRQRLERIVASLNLGDAVRFLGPVSDNVLAAAYRACDIFLLPTRELQDPQGRPIDVEGFGMVFLEANLAGKPVIAGRSGGVPDAVTAGVNGLLVDPDRTGEIRDAMIALGTDTARRRMLGEQARRFAESFLRDDVGHRRFSLMLGKPPEKLVSIVVPAHNAEATLGQSLDGVLRQTYRPTEVIVVDDGSTDQTASILEHYALRMAIIRQEHRGAAAARNRGFDASKGEYVFFCDADVTLEPTALEEMVRTLELHPEAAYCYPSFRFGWHTFDLFDFDAERLRRENYISTMALIRREAFLRFDERLTRFQDWDLWKRMLANEQRGIWLPKRLFFAPLRGGMSRDSPRDFLKLLRHWLTGR